MIIQRKEFDCLTYEEKKEFFAELRKKELWLVMNKGDVYFTVASNKKESKWKIKGQMALFSVLFVSLFFLTGCDTVADIYTAVASFFESYLSAISCWSYNLIVNLINGFIAYNCGFIDLIVLALPDVPLPSIDISGIPFFQYAAFFLPLSEAALLLKGLIAFTLAWWLGATVMRWLKLWR